MTTDVAFKARSSVRFLSGMYGLLKPTDLIQRYRLEMSCKLKVGSHVNLYRFWEIGVTKQINDELLCGVNGVNKLLLILASEEYAKVVLLNLLDITITPVHFVFKDNGKVISIFAKRARGLMSRFVCEYAENTSISLDYIKTFAVDGYCFSNMTSRVNFSKIIYTLYFDRAVGVKGKEKLKGEKRFLDE